MTMVLPSGETVTARSVPSLTVMILDLAAVGAGVASARLKSGAVKDKVSTKLTAAKPRKAGRRDATEFMDVLGVTHSGWKALGVFGFGCEEELQDCIKALI